MKRGRYPKALASELLACELIALSVAAGNKNEPSHEFCDGAVWALNRLRAIETAGIR